MVNNPFLSSLTLSREYDTDVSTFGARSSLSRYPRTYLKLGSLLFVSTHPVDQAVINDYIALTLPLPASLPAGLLDIYVQGSYYSRLCAN